MANLTGEVGESVVSYMYDIYGTAEGGDVKEGGTGSSAENALWNPYLYRGEYTDYLTGNQYLRARYYRPVTGNFLTRDSYPGDPREPASLNRYTYAGNDPINLSDPSGHGWLKKKAQQAKAAVKKTASKAKKAVKSAAKTVKKTAAKVVKKTKTVVKKAKKTATKIKKKVCTTAKRIKKATVSFVKNVDWKKVAIGAVTAVAIAGAVALTGGAAAGGNGQNGIANTETGSKTSKVRTGDQQALDNLAEESVRRAKKGNPISKEEARILDEWAKEYKVSQHHGVQDGSGSHFPGGGFQDHTHIYNKHVPYK